MDTICGVRAQQKTAMLILKTMYPDGERLCSIHKQSRRGSDLLVHMDSYYISYHKSFPFLVLKMGSPRIYGGTKTFNTKTSQVCGRTVLRLQAHKANQENSKDDKESLAQKTRL